MSKTPREFRNAIYEYLISDGLPEEVASKVAVDAETLSNTFEAFQLRGIESAMKQNGYPAKSVNNDKNSLQKGGSDTDVTRKVTSANNAHTTIGSALIAFAIKTHEAKPGEDETPNFTEALATIKQLALDALPKKLDVDDMRSWEDGYHRAGRNTGIDECRQALEKVMVGKQ